ncbi:hypothetical protein ACH5RR_012377 [Cinchona calisaya]|uniref:Uncharacterized protein n=1 Tax=Cinchona calisaya TaxID=153742 RepID=A0ABD3A7J2_9GENT
MEISSNKMQILSITRLSRNLHMLGIGKDGAEEEELEQGQEKEEELKLEEDVLTEEKDMRGRGKDEEIAERHLLSKDEGYLGGEEGESVKEGLGMKKRGRERICGRGGLCGRKEREKPASEGKLHGKKNGEGRWS